MGDPKERRANYFMSPYYSHGGITIYHGDCSDIVPQLGRFDLLLTDPPYGIKADRDRNSQANGWRDFGSSGWDSVPVSVELLQLCMSVCEESIILGGNYFNLPPSMGFLIWFKMQTEFSLADCEYAWRSKQCAARVFSYSRAKAQRDLKQHPTQKPEALMQWCLNKAGEPKTVLDPFMGSGTTLRACKDAGIECVGIDREERYCEIAARRMDQEVFAL